MNQNPCYSPSLLPSFFEMMRAVCHQVLDSGTPTQRQEVAVFSEMLERYLEEREREKAAWVARMRSELPVKRVRPRGVARAKAAKGGVV